MITLKKTLVYNTELNERRILIKSLLQLFVVIIVLIVYFPVLGHDFLYFWDDQWVVMNRYDPFFFHAASLLLHVSSALLVFACVERFLLVNTKIQTAYPLLIAFFTALLFAVHPFNVESVAWMSASKILVYACYSFVEYLFKCIFPFKLSYLYPFPSVVGDALPSWLLVYPGLLTIALIAFGKYIWKNSVLLFSLIFFLIHLAVALHLIPLSRFAVVADRYAYISSIGVCFALSYGVVYLFKTCGKKLRIMFPFSLDATYFISVYIAI